MALSEKANNVNWLMANFVRSTPGVEQAMAVSSDGLLIALSSQLERASADKMAAIITGIRDGQRLPLRQRHLGWFDTGGGHGS